MWINRYKDSPWHKTLGKELYFIYRYGAGLLGNRLRARTVLFYPEYPVHRTEINKLLHRLGYNVTNNPRLHCEYVFAWQDTTFRQPQPLLDELARRHKVLNLGCDDISKEKLDAVFSRVFGYSLAVDPTTYDGHCVRKSNINAQHDGAVVQCPIAAPEAGYVYQRLIDNRAGEDAAGDMRAPIYGDSIPLLYLRYRPLESRFHGDYLEQLCDTEEYLSPGEIGQVLRFARAMGLDYGTVDMLRDPADGRLYIVDVNNTPWDPDHRSAADCEEALVRGMAAFQDAFMADAAVDTFQSRQARS